MTAKKAFPQKSFPATVTFRPDQFAIVRRLQDQRKLSEVCQQAVDLDAELEALPDGSFYVAIRDCQLPFLT